ncbi:hypothetical protein FDC27_15025, partial [Clostridium botulinum]|nr:hypothetical protein [Clostridium botulinum]
MAKFNMMELLNNNSKENINVENKSQKKFKTVPININELKPSDENFYSTENVVELKNSIELLGLQQNLVVKKTNDGYEIIAGHRRYKALKMLFEEGKKDFEYVPCKVENEKDALKVKWYLCQGHYKKRARQQEADFCIQQESAFLNSIDNGDYYNT